MPAEEFDDWCIYHRHFPLDDQSNFHYPIAQLEATLININRAQGAPAVTLFDRLIFKKRPAVDPEDFLENGDW